MKTKKIASIITLIIVLLMLPLTISVNANEVQITSGTYYQLGRYNNQPVIWRAVVSNDENGILMVSDKILCYKIFDADIVDGFQGITDATSFWENTSMRVWLNSAEEPGAVKWVNNHIPTQNRVFKRPFFHQGDYPYADERGFLNDENFTTTEKSVMKSVSHWQALSEENTDLSENGLSKPFYPRIVRAEGSQYEQIMYRYKIEEMGTAYYGAMYRVSDTVMTLDEKQLYNSLIQLGTVAAENAEGAQPSYDDVNGIYWLRTPVNTCAITTATKEGKYGLENVHCDELGVRPAFYLNEENMIMKSGSGTEEDPYVIDGKPPVEIPVFCNGKQLEFDVQPVEENDRLLVPVRAIFEELGAEVTYDDGDGVITANNGERTVIMQIDNPEMGNGTEVFTLDVAPKLVNDRTLVPLRAVAEAFDCKVDWIEELDRVVIDPPQPEDTDEGHQMNVWDIWIHGESKK